MTKVKKGPYFIRYDDPLIRAVKELGGSGTPTEVVEIVARLKNLSEEEQKQTLMTRASRFVNQAHFARQHLVWKGLLGLSKRGVWSLKEKGIQMSELSHTAAWYLFERQHALHTSLREKDICTTEILRIGVASSDDTSPAETHRYRKEVLEILRKLTPESLDRPTLCPCSSSSLSLTGQGN